MVRIAHCFSHTAISFSSDVVHPKLRPGWLPRVGGTATEWDSLPISMPAAWGCTTAKLRSSLWIFRIISRRCLRFILYQLFGVGRQLALLSFSPRLGFMLIFPQ